MQPGRNGFKVRPEGSVIKKTVTERFIEKIKVDPVLGCWLWQGSASGSTKSHQYGMFCGDEGKNVTAHIWAYKRFVGPVPKGTYCCHRCDNTMCVNPYHLFLGSQKDNLQDARAKGRMPSFKERGQDSPALIAIKRRGCSFKLTEADVLAIRHMYANGIAQTALGKKFNVDQTTVRAIVLRQTWKHL